MDTDACRRRRDALARAAASRGVGHVLLTDTKHIYYFTGFSVLFPGVRNRTDLVVDNQGRATLLVSAPLAEGAGPHADTVVPIEHSLVRGAPERDALFDAALKAATGRSSAELQPTEAALQADMAHMRRRKDKQEQEQLRHLGRLAGVGYDAIQRRCVSGKTELDLLLAAKAACVHANEQDLFVSGDFVSGPRTLEMGGPATARRLETGDNVIVDLWLVGDHYWSDTCRTFCADGDPTDEQSGVLGMLSKAKSDAEESIRAGVEAGDIYRQIQGDLERHGHHCPHHLGHGFGLDSWEPPFITADTTDRFEEGMAFTIEIGVYGDEHTASRIEDNYFVTEGGVTRISGADRGYAGSAGTKRPRGHRSA